VLGLARFGQVEADRLGQRTAQFLHVGTSGEPAGQFKDFGPQLLARPVVDAHSEHLIGHHSPPPLSPACRMIAIDNPMG
jgi:hypothetical protein